MSRVERRDPHAIYHPTGLDGLAALTPPSPAARSGSEALSTATIPT